MADKHALEHIRQVQLSTFEIKTLGLISQKAGEIDWFPDQVKPVVNQCIDVMRDPKGLVELRDANGNAIEIALDGNVGRLIMRHGSRLRLRLTDQGRAIAAQLDAMLAKPKLEVTMPQ